MRVIVPGHVYGMFEVDGTPERPAGEQKVQFVVRRDDRAELLPEDERTPGLLSQELVRVLIDRVRYLNDEDPCQEDVEIIHHLRDVLRLFEARAARRTIEKLSMPETAEACPICHHVLCAHRHPLRLSHEVRR